MTTDSKEITNYLKQHNQLKHDHAKIASIKLNNKCCNNCPNCSNKKTTPYCNVLDKKVTIANTCLYHAVKVVSITKNELLK
jgi:hypothetical protein